MAGSKPGGSSKKQGRNRRKKLKKGVSPISKFVRGKITAEAYFKAINQKG